MVDVGIIGAKRLEYLDLANKMFSSNDFQQAGSYLESFMTTVRDNSKMADDIKKEFDEIEKKRIDTWNKIIEETTKLDDWTQSEIRSEQRIALSVEVLHDKIDGCWKVAMAHGAFND